MTGDPHVPDYIEAARIEAMLWREQLAEPEDRPSLEESAWVENIPCGPRDPDGLRRLQAIQARYGSVNVTTGNASPGAKGLLCGIYVREDVLEAPETPLRSYLSRPPEDD